MTKEDREEERRQPIGEANPGGRSEATISSEAIISSEDVRANAYPNDLLRRADDVSDSEVALRQACKAIATLIRRSYEVSRVEIVGKPAMHYINRRETGVPTSDRPFYAKQKV